MEQPDWLASSQFVLVVFFLDIIKMCYYMSNYTIWYKHAWERANWRLSLIEQDINKITATLLKHAILHRKHITKLTDKMSSNIFSKQ